MDEHISQPIPYVHALDIFTFTSIIRFYTLSIIGSMAIRTQLGAVCALLQCDQGQNIPLLSFQYVHDASYLKRIVIYVCCTLRWSRSNYTAQENGEKLVSIRLVIVIYVVLTNCTVLRQQVLTHLLQHVSRASPNLHDPKIICRRLD